jgi:Spy/CpxP family protein refolding chaperone
MVSMLVAMVSIGGLARADDEVDAKGGRTKILMVTIQDLNLTDEQEAQIAKIREECRPKVQEAATELRALVKEELEKISAVLTPEQKPKVAALIEERREERGERREERAERREERREHPLVNLEEVDLTEAEMARIDEIRSEFRARREKAEAALADLLNDEQKKAREEALGAGKTRKEVLQALKLTNEQKEKVAGVARELGAVLKEEAQQIGEVLAAGQKEKLQELREERREQVRDRAAHRIANLRELELTAEQKEKIAAVRTEYRPKIQEAGNKLRAAIREEAQMLAAVLK